MRHPATEFDDKNRARGIMGSRLGLPPARAIMAKKLFPCPQSYSYIFLYTHIHTLEETEYIQYRNLLSLSLQRKLKDLILDIGYYTD